MKFITDYAEFSGDPQNSVLDHMAVDAIAEKAIVLEYLYDGKNDGIRCSWVYDYVKKERQGEAVRLYTDGEYYWDSEEIYHFYKYNIKLNDEFISKVVKAHQRKR